MYYSTLEWTEEYILNPEKDKLLLVIIWENQMEVAGIIWETAYKSLKLPEIKYRSPVSPE